MFLDEKLPQITKKTARNSFYELAVPDTSTTEWDGESVDNQLRSTCTVNRYGCALCTCRAVHVPKLFIVHSNRQVQRPRTSRNAQIRNRYALYDLGNRSATPVTLKERFYTHFICSVSIRKVRNNKEHRFEPFFRLKKVNALSLGTIK
jgi:hypothetical protein